MQMQKMIVDTESLLEEIQSAFPFLPMPDENEIVFHMAGCHVCDGLKNDLGDYRGKEITGEVIRLVHQELSSLSAKGLQWILPHYVRFCLTPEAEYNQMEIEFLIYSLRPALEFQRDTLIRLSLLNKEQITCLIHFLMWCENQAYWNEFYLDDINEAKEFLSSMI